MATINVNGITLQFDDLVSLTIVGDSVLISTKPASPQPNTTPPSPVTGWIPSTWPYQPQVTLTTDPPPNT